MERDFSLPYVLSKNAHLKAPDLSFIWSINLYRLSLINNLELLAKNDTDVNHIFLEEQT
jgi:hypothetical protein